jgi:16S rRNA (adenine1518-N6/adenine1519-N6)-dimethyltransferase
MPTRLGQNFLKNDKIVKKIVAAADLKADDFVLEIGPGRGILTEELAKYAGKVLAIEIDELLIEPLTKKFNSKKNVEIIHENILNINLAELIKQKFQDKNYKVIANIPYYITSPIIRLFLENENPPSEMILMVQKEVAERIVAKPGQMSILAISVQYYADAEILFEVGKENFEPAPEVDSAVIRMSRITKIKEERIKTNDFFRIVKAGFSAKRKTLINNLSNSLHLDKTIIEEKIKTVGLKPTVRAQELSVEDWKKLTALIKIES